MDITLQERPLFIRYVHVLLLGHVSLRRDTSPEVKLTRLLTSVRDSIFNIQMASIFPNAPFFQSSSFVLNTIPCTAHPMCRHKVIVHFPHSLLLQKLVYDLLALFLFILPFFCQENMKNRQNPVFQVVTQCHTCPAKFCDDQ